MARAGLGRIRSAGPGTFARAIDGDLGTATTSTPVALRQGAGPPGPSRWMASRCVTGRSERTLAEPPLCVGRGVLGVAQPRRTEQADPRDAMGVPPGDLGIVTIRTPRRWADGGEERRCAGHRRR